MRDQNKGMPILEICSEASVEDVQYLFKVLTNVLPWKTFMRFAFASGYSSELLAAAEDMCSVYDRQYPHSTQDAHVKSSHKYCNFTWNKYIPKDKILIGGKNK